MNKVVLAGGSGYLGSVLADFYRPKAKEVIILSRKKLADRDMFELFCGMQNTSIPG